MTAAPCTNHAAHGPHEWYEGNVFRRDCPGVTADRTLAALRELHRRLADAERDNRWDREVAQLVDLAEEIVAAAGRLPAGRPGRLDRDTFARHAAPEAIAAYLRQAQTATRAWQRHADWLAELYEKRTNPTTTDREETR